MSYETMTKREALARVAELEALIAQTLAAHDEYGRFAVFGAARVRLEDADTGAALREWHSRQHEGETLTIASDWIVADTGVHTCGGGTAESNGVHEPGCGLEPLVNVSEHMREERARVLELASARYVYDPETRRRLSVFVGEIREGRQYA